MYALLPDSPAINAGSNAACAETDQRGISRPQGAVCDIGAYELVDEVYLIDLDAPTVRIRQADTQSDPADETPILFSVEFSTPAGRRSTCICR